MSNVMSVETKTEGNGTYSGYRYSYTNGINLVNPRHKKVVGLNTRLYKIRYRNTGEIITSLIMKDKELMRDIISSRRQVRIGKLLNHKDLFND